MMNRSFRSRALRYGALTALFVGACSPTNLVDAVKPPGTVVDPAAVKTATGAQQMYNQVLTSFAIAYGGGNGVNVILATGDLTDEFMERSNNTNQDLGWDERTDNVVAFASVSSTSMSAVYREWHVPRQQASQARQALQLYAPTAPAAWRGQLFSLEANILLWFAEVYCSGIPLTVYPLEGSPTLSAGFSTEELFTRAATLFDSAITLSVDSARLLNLAKVGKARALLGLGRFADAATAVQGVPTDFVYNVEYGPVSANGSRWIGGNYFSQYPTNTQTVDREGGNGFIWSTDPRTAMTSVPALSSGMKFSAKYAVTAAGTIDPTTSTPGVPIRLATGVEARLIEAEADLAAGGSAWLATLNSLRSTCVGTAVCAPLPGLTAAALPPLADPGTPPARLNLLLQERAMWLFFTGHREGDLRRLAHVYNRDPQTLWPTGIYSNPGFAPLIPAARFDGIPYGNDVVAQPDPAEVTTNPLYKGCFDTNP